VPEQTALADIEPEAQAILLGLPADGSTIGNGRLRSQLDLDPDRYNDLTWNLKAQGLAVDASERLGSDPDAGVVDCTPGD